MEASDPLEMVTKQGDGSLYRRDLLETATGMMMNKSI